MHSGSGNVAASAKKVAGIKAQLDKVKSRLEFLRGKRRTYMRQ